MEDLFHSGELEIQKQVGELEAADKNKKLITPYIVKGAINFVEKQPMAFVASKDEKGNLWASVLIGNFGFVKIPEPTKIIFDTRNLISDPSDIFHTNIKHSQQIGSLFIELDSRKRLRVNGSCKIVDSKIELTVEQSYPNCPKYIQRRVVSMPEYFEKADSGSTRGKTLTDEQIKWISKTDTFFVVSSGDDETLDASHRGGNPGFIEVMDNGLLKIPDYPGASYFNTFGNMIQNPKTGLLFIDFEKRETLQLTGTASLLFDQKSEADLLKTKGTGRFWLFQNAGWIHTTDHHRVQWNFLEYSPFNP